MSPPPPRGGLTVPQQGNAVAGTALYTVAGLVTKDRGLSILFFGIASLWSSQRQSKKLNPPETTVVENHMGEMWSTTPAEPRRHAVPTSHHRREPSWAGRPAPVEPPGDGKPRGKLRGHQSWNCSNSCTPTLRAKGNGHSGPPGLGVVCHTAGVTGKSSTHAYILHSMFESPVSGDNREAATHSLLSVKLHWQDPT